ncbi:hypothetical protein ACIQ7Q_33730 [Streptomyces sp. NPDC096176]|uniref:hypothetical protein n=1 Tax=Streptomyces sp. NPDC096176 TaxID=3366079 RepID=UPI00382D71AA
MTLPTDGTAPGARADLQLLAWITALTALVAIIATFILAMTGHGQEATAVAGIGAAICAAAGGIRVTVNIKR